MTSPEPLIIAHPDLLLPEGQAFFTHDDQFAVDERGRLIPNFTVRETSKFFFGKTVEWIRWRIREGYFILDGQEVGTRRDDVTGFRYFTLPDIERMAHALARVEGGLDGLHLNKVVLLVKTVADMYRIS